MGYGHSADQVLFSGLIEMRSFTQAADSLFISRQALRKSVARLAQEMGEPLFENRGNVLFPRRRPICCSAPRVRC
ncbi:MAG: LysR family transcriptional regulator [Adlercreutzia equolifaciens]